MFWASIWPRPENSLRKASTLPGGILMLALPLADSLLRLRFCKSASCWRANACKRAAVSLKSWVLMVRLTRTCLRLGSICLAQAVAVSKTAATASKRSFMVPPESVILGRS